MPHHVTDPRAALRPRRRDLFALAGSGLLASLAAMYLGVLLTTAS